MCHGRGHRWIRPPPPEPAWVVSAHRPQGTVLLAQPSPCSLPQDDWDRLGKTVDSALIPPDTSQEAHRVQTELYKLMGGAARLGTAFRLTEAVRLITLAGIRQRHPEYTDDQAWSAWARLTLGDDVFRQVWPNRPLLQP